MFSAEFQFILNCLGKYFSQSEDLNQIEKTYQEYLSDREKYGPQFGDYHGLEKFMVGSEEEDDGAIYYLMLNQGKVWLLEQHENECNDKLCMVDIYNPPYMGNVYY
jgi:hypothetical protein